MKFKIATPERIMLETEVDSLTLPTTMGEVTILPNHIPLVATLEPGEIRYKHGATNDFFAVSGGIIEVKKGGEVVVLADSAEFAHEIDIEKAEAAREEAQKLMTEAGKDQKSYSDASAMFRTQLVRLNVARKHHSHKGTKISNQ
jgi:F-type H+-transporting ATPase subunit epsilon